MALTKAAKKERNARILGILVLGAITASATSYIIAPRFQEPVAIIDEANSSLAQKIIVNERISLLTSQQSRQGLAKAELLEIQNRFPSATEMASLEQAVNQAILASGLTPSALTRLVFETEFVPVADPTKVVDPKATAPAPAEEETQDANAEPKMYSKKMSLSVVGSPANLIALISELTSLERVIVIDEINIVNDPKLGLNVLNIEARTFIMPDALGSETEAVDLDEVDSIFDGEDAATETNN